ncbi:lipopolysaccharide assembly protein LapB [Methanobrevibacter sp. UBA212]|uniref:tetratricopeptide repeat protein n=1 Tax=Methanobrevibacter sp. UBA212 TaxID=1915476 RepID=UPI0025E095D3|nr:CDC27 family protein [Methanobrevibacter sp. UBA212]
MTTEITKILNGFKKFSENPYSDAIKFLKDYIEVEPTDEAHFELGKALFLNDEYDESIKYLNLSNHPKSDAYIGLDFYRKEDFLNAIRHFNEFLKRDENETVLSYLMISYENTRDWRNAVLTGERLLEIRPENESVKLRMVDYHYSLREYEKSLAYINELESRKLRCKKGLVLFRLEQYDEAIKTLESLKTAEAYSLMAKSYLKLNKHAKALSCAFKSYKSSRDPEIILEFSDIYLDSDYKRAIHILKRLLDENPGDERVLERICRAYIGNFEAGIAITYAEDLLKVNETNVTAYLTLAEAYQYLDNGMKSLEYIEKGLELNSESVELWVMKAWTLYPFDFEGFRKSLERAIALDPNNTENHVTLIRECVWEREMGSASRYYKRLMLYNPTFSKTFDELTKDIIDCLNSTNYLAWCPYCGI